MTEEITYYDDELTEIIRTLEEGVDGLARKRPAAKAEVSSHDLLSTTSTSSTHTHPTPRPLISTTSHLHDAPSSRRSARWRSG